MKNWLLDRLETPKYRKGTKDNPELTTTAQMADVASADAEFLQVAALYRGRPDFDVAALVAELVEGEAVPFLPILRYKPTGLRKREVWERTWDLQRQQDAGKDVGEIPVPPKYATADFLKTDFWRLRGKLDVPKERWISYPHCSTESDPTLVVGWAGGITLSRRRPWSPTTTPANGKAGTPNDSRRSWRASINSCRGFINGIPRLIKNSARRRANRSKRCWSTTPMNSV